MAKMHSGGRGRSRSKEPMEKASPEWVEFKPHEAEELVLSLANKGKTPAEIGLALRDQYGIPSVKKLTRKRIEKILEEGGMKSEFPRDLLNLIRRSVQLAGHMKENRKDMSAKRGYQLTVSKIRRLTAYYAKQKKLPKNWRYTPEQAELLVK